MVKVGASPSRVYNFGVFHEFMRFVRFDWLEDGVSASETR